MYLLGLQINLPWPILAHASFLVFTGLLMILSPTTSHPTSSVMKTPNSSQSLLGIATLGLGLAYFSTAYMQVEENQFFHASAPVRIILGVAMLLKVAVAGTGMRDDERMKLLGLGVYDLLGGVFVGYWLGTWGGRVL